MNYTKDGFGWTPITEKEVKDQIQYWYSRWYNSQDFKSPEREAYWALYLAYKQLEDAYKPIWKK